MRRFEDEKIRYRPPLLEEPCAQTLSGKTCSKPPNSHKSSVNDGTPPFSMGKSTINGPLSI